MTKTELGFVQSMSLGILGKKGELILLNWKLQKQIQGCLYGLAKDQRLTFKKAHMLLKGKTLPKVYFDKINLYLKENS